MKTKKLSAMPYAQAQVLFNDYGDIYLQSYNTIVASIVNSVLEINGLYSMTTRKHLSAFAREYANLYDFSIIKRIVNEDEGYNINTQKIVKVV